METTCLAFGHRGASGHEPENTLRALARARELGADGVEFDVQLTGDGVAVVFHDDAVDRTTDGAGRVADLSAAELSAFDAGSWFDPAAAGERVPTLAAWLAAAGDALALNLELKVDAERTDQAYADDLAAAALAEVEGAGLLGRTVFSSFATKPLRALRRLSSDARIGVLALVDSIDRAFVRAGELGAETFHPPFVIASAELVGRAHDAGLAVWVWTANDAADMDALIDAGVDAIISDYPDRVVAARERAARD